MSAVEGQTIPPVDPPAEPPTEPAEDKPAAALTEYVVLEAGEDMPEGTWAMGPKISARSGNAAIRAHAAKAGDGVYAAVPARSWAPVTVKTETKTQLTFS